MATGEPLTSALRSQALLAAQNGLDVLSFQLDLAASTIDAMDADRSPRLGYATTRELLAEITARIEVDRSSGGGGLDYRTCGDGA